MRRLFRPPSGNAVVFVLIGIALFAALAYAVSRSGRGNSNINQEQMALIARQIMADGQALENAVYDILVNRGFGDTQLSFAGWAGKGTDYDNANCTVNACRVFHPEGGGVSPDMELPAPFFNSGAGYEYAVVTGNTVLGHATDTADGTGSDLILFFSISSTPEISADFCDAYNALAGLKVTQETFQRTFFDGAYSYNHTIGDQAAGGGFPAASILTGKKTGCVKHPTLSEYAVYYVLHAR